MVDLGQDDDDLELLKECFSGSGNPSGPVKAAGFASLSARKDDDIRHEEPSSRPPLSLPEPDECSEEAIRRNGKNICDSSRGSERVSRISSSDEKACSESSRGGLRKSSEDASFSSARSREGSGTMETSAAPPVRGKSFTRPAWLTANLIQAAPVKSLEEEEIERVEKEIEKVKCEISELEKVIVCKRALREELKGKYASSLSAQIPRVSRFSVDIERRGGLALGLSVGYDESRRGFLVSEVKSEGSVPLWNQRNRGACKVQVGDLIVSVNGIGGNREEMTREFKAIRVSLVIEPFKSNLNAVPRPLSSSGSSISSLSKFSAQSVEVYSEIMEAIKCNEGPRTGLMRFGDIPIRVPDNASGLFHCDVCRICVRTSSEWIDHFISNQHGANREKISTPDLWSRYFLGEDIQYWYEHKMGFWSVDEPNRRGTGSHTVAISNSNSNALYSQSVE